MNKDQAVEYMINTIEKIEKERIASHPTVDSTQKKKEAVEQILKELKGVEIDED